MVEQKSVSYFASMRKEFYNCAIYKFVDRRNEVLGSNVYHINDWIVLLMNIFKILFACLGFMAYQHL